MKYGIFPLFVALSLAVSPTDAAESEDQYDLDEVVVTGSRGSILSAELPMIVSVIGKERIENRYESSLLTVVNEQIPGFFNTSRGMMGYGISTGAAGGMNIRGIGGTNSAEMLILIDGHPQFSGLMGHPIADVYQSAFADRIEVVRGPASVLYGSNAMGGVVNIITDRAKRDGWINSAMISGGSYGSLQSWVNSHFKKDRFFSSASLLYNRSDGHRANMEYSQLQGAINLGYTISDALTASVVVNIADIKSENPGLETAPIVDNNANILRSTASLVLDNSFGIASGALTVFHNWGDHTINDGHAVDVTPLTYKFRSDDELSGISFYENIMLSEGNKTTFGFDYMHTWGMGWFKHDDGTLSSPWRKDLPRVSKEADEIAGYVNIHQKLLGVFSADAGVRYNHHSLVGNEIVPQFGLAANLHDIGTFKFIVGKGYRNPTFKDMYLFPSQNPDLDPEELINYEISYSSNLIDGDLHIEVSCFHIDVDNVILTIPVSGGRLNVNSGELKNDGVELLARYRLMENLAFSANYSFLHMEHPVVAAPEHKAFFEADWTNGKFRITSGLQYIAGLYTDVTPGAEIQQDYLLWNARASYALSENCSFFLRGENLLNRLYEINAGYPMPGITLMSGVSVHF